MIRVKCVDRIINYPPALTNQRKETITMDMHTSLQVAKNPNGDMSIAPLSPRQCFETRSQTVVVSANSPAWLRPVGGDVESCYVEVQIVKGALTFMKEPFNHLDLSINFLARKYYSLDRLAGVVDDKPTIYTGTHTPLCQIVAVDASAGTLTIDLDKDVEVFDPFSVVALSEAARSWLSAMEAARSTKS